MTLTVMLLASFMVRIKWERRACTCIYRLTEEKHEAPKQELIFDMI